MSEPRRGSLAYVFWHWKRPEIPRGLYEDRQLAFQAALAAHPPSGFRSGSTYRLSGAAWAGAGGAAYEDWYLVDDMAALERLNEAAVTAARQAPHDAVAALAAGGTAGLYGLRAGIPHPAPRVATWFAKPAGLSYAALDALLQPLLSGGQFALWSRRMTLGPTQEFCLHSASNVALPEGFAPQRISLEPLTGPAAP